MKTIKHGIYDRSDWPPGPWDTEPDRVAWVDPKTGYPCLLKRNTMGAWCGYVGVPKGHPAHGAGYDDEIVDKLSVHGGITYGDECVGDPETGICHVSETGDHVWWLGFDCVHCGDAYPALGKLFAKYANMPPSPGVRDKYKNQRYAERETLSLAQQLKALET